jgi:hypothetical protein
MNTRRLKNGSFVESFDYPIDLIIHTKAPGKWKIIDMETGEEYYGSANTHPSYGIILKNKVASGKIGSWVKDKLKGSSSHE